ncbi:MAG: hypothetical protein L0I76_14280 [Pseudonocardia sp.]|nr:hypothetical protein [Pseudonocardia sp.]
MNRYWHVTDGSVRTPSGGSHGAPAPCQPGTLSVEQRFECILALEHLRDATASKLMHDVADRAIASMEGPVRTDISSLPGR